LYAVTQDESTQSASGVISYTNVFAMSYRWVYYTIINALYWPTIEFCFRADR